MIEPTTDAIKKLIDFTDGSNYATIQAIGLLTGVEVATIEQPVVMNYDEANDAHWVPVVYSGTAFELNITTNCLGVPFRGIFRLNKGVTVNPVGFMVS